MKSGFHWSYPVAGLLGAVAVILILNETVESPAPTTPVLRAPPEELCAAARAASALRTFQGGKLDVRLEQINAGLSESDRLILIQRIAGDSTMRRFFNRLLGDVCERNPQSFLPMWDAMPEDADRSAWFLPIAKGWSRRDPTEAASWLGDQPQSEARDRALLLAVAAAAKAGDTAMSLQQLRALDAASPDRQALATLVLSEALRADPASVTHWRSRMSEDDPAYLPAVTAVAHELAAENVQAAVDLIDAAIEPGPTRDRLLADAMARPE